MQCLRIVAVAGTIFGCEDIALSQATGGVGRVACVGDSITYGAFLSSPETSSYPARLQALLGARWKVSNFGAPDHAVGPWTRHPYRRHPAWQAARDFGPDVVVLLLGTNDGQSRNWRSDDAFLRAAFELVNDIRSWRRWNGAVAPPDVLVALPPPVCERRYDLQPELIRDHVVLRWCELAAHHRWHIVDTHSPFVGRRDRFPDGVHLDEAGALALASMVYDALTRPGAPGAGPENEPWDGLEPRVPVDRALAGADWLLEHQQWCERIRTTPPEHLVICNSPEVASAFREVASDVSEVGVLLAEGERACHVFWRVRHGACAPPMSRIVLCPDLPEGGSPNDLAEANAWWTLGRFLRTLPHVQFVGWALPGRSPRSLKHNERPNSLLAASAQAVVVELRSWARSVVEWMQMCQE